MIWPTRVGRSYPTFLDEKWGMAQGNSWATGGSDPANVRSMCSRKIGVRDASCIVRFVIFFAVIAGTVSGIGQIIPPNRVASWSSATVGVPGGIPVRTNIYTTFAPGATAAQINTAIANCPSNQVVYLSAGKFSLTGPLHFHTKWGCTLRGAGPGQTILDLSAVASAGITPIDTDQSGQGTWVALTNGFSAGSSNIMVANPSSFSVNGVISIAEDMEPGLVYAESTNHWNAVRGIVTAISGNTLTVWPPLIWTLKSNLNPIASPESPTGCRFCGLEDLTINCGTNTTSGYTIWFDSAYGCWIKNVESIWCNTMNIFFTSSLRCEIRHCYIHDNNSYQDGAAIEVWGGTAYYHSGANGFLIEDNIFSRMDAGVLLEGASGSVIAYNLATNDLTAQWVYQVPAYNCNHGAHSMMNLWEGNIGEGWQSDGYHGSASHQTLFRNWFNGMSTNSPHNRKMVDLCRASYGFNVVGNVLGDPSWSSAGQYEMTGNPATYSDTGCIYRLGYPSIGNNSYTEPTVLTNSFGPFPAVYPDTNVNVTLLRHGNYDYFSKAIVWDPTITNHTLPSSYLYGAKPAYFGELKWPPFDPANPSGSSPTNIPAGYRYIFGTDPPLSSSGSQTPVAVASANPITGPAPLSVGFSSAGSVDPLGGTTAYSWSFGDGNSSTAANPTHVYQSAGNYSAQLTVTDGTNSSQPSMVSITVTAQASNQPPVAVSSATPTSGAAPLSVSFSSSGSYDPEGAALTYNWTFGDGTSSTAANPSHSYQTAGTYTARLGVSDGTNTTQAGNLTIQATNLAPAIVLTSPVAGAGYAAPATITCTASVTANGHTINQVQFYNGGTLLGTVATAPYTFNWQGVGIGAYSIGATVIYDSSNSLACSPVNVSVGGLVAAYGFEEGSGTNVTDSSGQGNNGLVNGATWTSGGRYGWALSFNGTNSAVQVNDSPSLDLTSALTLEAWVNPSVINNDFQAAVTKPLNPEFSAVSYVLNGASRPNGVPSLGLALNPPNLFGTSVLQTNAWSHVAGTYDGANMQLYVNGVLVSSQTNNGALTISNLPLSIGVGWVGLLDEVRIYNRALSVAEIQNDMNTPILARPAPPTGFRVVGGF